MIAAPRPRGRIEKQPPCPIKRAQMNPVKLNQEQILTMALRDKLEEDIKESMRNRDQARLDALRFLKFAVQAVEKEQKKELDDAGMVEVAT